MANFSVRKMLWIAGGALGACMAGCDGPPTVAGRAIEDLQPVRLSLDQQWQLEQDADSPARRERGKIWMLDGVCGDLVSVQHNCRLGLLAAGLPWAMEIWGWQYGWRGGWICDVTDLPRLREQAGRLIEKIREYQQQYPHRPIRLVGVSAGSAVVTFALEQLPPDSVVDVVFLSSALSSGYDLTRALTAVRRRMIVVHSPHDWLILNLCTSVIGTADRRHEAAAGATGFSWDAESATPEQRAQYAKLVQIGWEPWMMRLGYFGEHATSSSTSFAARVLAPLLAEDGD